MLAIDAGRADRICRSLHQRNAVSAAFFAGAAPRLAAACRDMVEYDVDADAAAGERLVHLTGQRMVPTLVEAGRVVSVGWHGRGCMV